MIRKAQPNDLNALREIERAAGAAFAHLGMDEIAEDEPPAVEELTAFQTDGRAMQEHDLTRGLRAIRKHEATLGLDRWPRVVMRRHLDALPAH